jgi:hypothetical protein
MNIIRIYNLLFPLINIQENPDYFSGRRFIDKVREFDIGHPTYPQYIELMRTKNELKSRKDYYLEILESFNTDIQIAIVNSIIEDLENKENDNIQRIRELLNGANIVPNAVIAEELWNAERLTRYLSEIDNSISQGNYERATTLSYTCLEGFFKSFVNANIPEQNNVTEIVRLARIIRSYLRENVENYPDEAISLLNNITHTVDRTRNQFSEAHFGEETQRWLAIYIRDLVNSQIRMLLTFM